jgi:sigma-B regulation protein RsbU (phosphoserine phosphatase)
VSADPTFLRAGPARAAGIRAAFAFPVLVGAEIVAVLEFFATDAVAPDEPLLEVMGQVGTQLGRVIERDRRRRAEDQVRATREEFRIARHIHRKLFPASAPVLPGYDLAGLSRAAQATGGDYFDYLPLPGGPVGVVVGDVSGHGFGPALLMSQARAYLRALALSYADVGELLTRANQILTRDTEEDRFVTLFCARLDPGARSLRYAAAGHEGYHLSASGGVTRLPSTGLPLGVVEDAVVACAPAVALGPGDLVLCFTDGIPEAEAPGGAAFGLERTLEVVRAHQGQPARAIVEALHRAVQEFSHPLPQRDDITAVVIKAGAVPDTAAAGAGR